MSLFFATLATQNIFNNISVELYKFTDRTIGISILEGVDISLRSLLYVKAIVLFITTYSITNFLLSRLKKYIPISFFLKTETDFDIIIISSLSTSLSIALSYFSLENMYLKMANIFMVITFLNTSLLIAKYLFIKRDKIFFNYLNNYGLSILSLLVPMVTFFIRWAVIKGDYTFKDAYLTVYIVLWSAYWTFVYLISKYITKVNQKVISSGILLGAIPFLLIPASIVVANEFQFTLSNTILNKSVYFYVNLSILFLATLSVFVAAYSIFKKKIVNYYKCIKFIYLPIFIGTITLFKVHYNHIELPIIVDMFHHGENLISTQQLFVFGKTPFLDVYPTHGLSYMISQILYSVINGYKPFEPWLWEWTTKIFEILLLYVSLTIVSNPYLATMATAFMPFLDIFGGGRFVYGYDTKLLTTYYFMAFLPSLILGWTINKPNTKRILLYSTICLFMFFWRIDFGIANLIAGIFVLGTIFIGQKFMNYKHNLNIKLFAKVFLSLTLLTVIFFYIITKISNTSLSQIFVQNLKFILFQADAQGLINIFGQSLPLVAVQYLIYPIIAIVYIINFLNKVLVIQDRKITTKDILLTSISVFSIVILMRSTQRQTLGVLGLNQYLFTFLGLCMPFYFIKFKNISVISFLILLFTYRIFLPSNFFLVNDVQQISIQNWTNRESRVKVNSTQYENVSSFLTKNLTGDQTFLDLTSSPLLYVTTNKEFPNYFVPNAYYTSETIQKNVLVNIEKLMEHNNIPIVIVKQPISAANTIDTVPNEVRSYRIYEYLYNNYLPMGIIDDYEIWTQKDFEVRHLQNLAPIKSKPSEFEIKRLSYVWAKFDDNNALQNTRTQAQLINSPINLEKNYKKIFKVQDKIDKSNGNYIYLRVKSLADGQITVSYGEVSDKTEPKVKFDIISSNQAEDYLIRISMQKEWLNKTPDYISLTSNIDIILEVLEIREGD